ncbi:DUF4302 domain-containing protein [Niabella hibiscisoli]|nr:DUF4302 domain-containing protein [Niabella hibiscisoli]
MLSDFSNATATTFKASTYRIKYVMNTSLIFDTYNYITTLQDPGASVNGGTNANGLQSDIEFEYLRSTPDSVILIGKRYRNYLYLIKASAAEKTSFENGGYLTAMNKLKNYFVAGFPHIVLNQGGTEKKIEMWINNSTKVVDGDYLTPQQSLLSAASGFAFGIDGAYFSNGLVSEGVRFRGIKWKTDTEMVAYDSAGTEYKVGLSPAPLTLLHLAVGAKFRLQANFRTIYPGTSTLGSAIVGQYVNNLHNAYSGFTFVGGALTFTFDIANRRLTVTGWHTQTAGAAIGTGGWNTVYLQLYQGCQRGIYIYACIRTSNTSIGGKRICTEPDGRSW